MCAHACRCAVYSRVTGNQHPSFSYSGQGHGYCNSTTTLYRHDHLKRALKTYLVERNCNVPAIAELNASAEASLPCAPQGAVVRKLLNNPLAIPASSNVQKRPQSCDHGNEWLTARRCQQTTEAAFVSSSPCNQLCATRQIHISKASCNV